MQALGVYMKKRLLVIIASSTFVVFGILLSIGISHKISYLESRVNDLESRVNDVEWKLRR